MATVVLQYAGAALGTMLGGPLGGAIGRAAGAMAGGIFDQQVFGKKQHVTGPRLTDLRVMASEEGVAIPAVWGRMRIAGQVIWSSGIAEVQSTDTQKASAKGGGSTRVTSYTYYSSFAVGLCEGEISGLGRVWADGKIFDPSRVNMRLYHGSKAQEPESLIVATEGADAVPAYRGLAYVVFERLPLAEFGNRIPQLSFEILRSSGAAHALRAVTIIPGSTEFGYDTTPVRRVDGPGQTTSENTHAASGETDWTVSLNQLQQVCPNVEAASLVVAWFGNDLRCGQCRLEPRVDQASKETTGSTWAVAGLTRGTATQVSQVNGRPAYGGTPSDASVIRAITDLKARGLKVMFYPFILMDIAAGNALPDPHGGASQPAYPWRGRITASVAPGRNGTPDRSVAMIPEIAAFVGQAAVSDFSVSASSVTYAGPDEWSLRRMVLHQAHLCAAAGGVDSFLIGSELRGLTNLRAAPSSYPFVDALVQLAADVKRVLPDARISYGADWSEYFGHQPNDGSGDVHFHLDPLWASEHVDFVGIDTYMPVTDWRDGTTHADLQDGRRSIHDETYLAHGLSRGEGHDWFYASASDRAAQLRTLITDGAAGKPWVFRYKDLASWWSNQHFNRPGGIEGATPTDWVPRSKPVWFTEIGCPAVDKGSNAPNLFVDDKSSETGLPPFSSGAPDDLLQLRFAKAVQSHWDKTGAHNPVSPIYGGPMVDARCIYHWCWDARPWPVFPSRTDIWSDGINVARGHWLNPRAGMTDLADLVAEVAARVGLTDIDCTAADGLVDGFVIDRPMSPREALEDLLRSFALELVESGGRLKIVNRAGPATFVNFASDDLVDSGANKPLLTSTRAQEADLPRAVRLGYADAGADYRQAAVFQQRAGTASRREALLNLPAAVHPLIAQARVDIALADSWASRTSLSFALPPSEMALEPGDLVSVDGTHCRVTAVTHGDVLKVEAQGFDAASYVAAIGTAREHPSTAVTGLGPSDVVMMDLAQAARGAAHAPWLAAQAKPWPGRLALLREQPPGNLDFNRVVDAPATMGTLLTPLPAGLLNRLDHTHHVDVRLYHGALSSQSLAQILAGGNLAAVGDAASGFEIIQFLSAELLAQSTYRLTGLLRGLGGSAAEMLPLREAGQRFVLLNAAVVQPMMSLADSGMATSWRLGPATRDPADPAFVHVQQQGLRRGLRPLAPVHLRVQRDATGLAFSWIRQSRLDADPWESVEVPLGEASESYVAVISDGTADKRRLELQSPGFFYSHAEMTADFGGIPQNVTLRVAQLSQLTGPGTFVERTIHV